MSLYSVKVSLKLRAGVAQRPIFAPILRFAKAFQIVIKHNVPIHVIAENSFRTAYLHKRSKRSKIPREG